MHFVLKLLQVTSPQESEIRHLNSAFKNLKTILTNLSLVIASEKYKSVIFTRCSYAEHPNIYLDHYTIPFSSNVT